MQKKDGDWFQSPSFFIYGVNPQITQITQNKIPNRHL